MSKKSIKKDFGRGREVPNSPSIADTIDYAKKIHNDMKDKNGDYLYRHLIRVATNLRKIYPDAPDDVVVAALLHDSIEDSLVTKEELREMGFSNRTVDLVIAVARPREDKGSYIEYIQGIIDQGDRDALMLKIADNMDNMDPQRIAAVRDSDPSTADRLLRKYTKSLNLLNQKVYLDKSSHDIMVRRQNTRDDDLNGIKYYLLDGRPLKAVREEGLLVKVYSVDKKTGELVEDNLLGEYFEKDGPQQEITAQQFEGMRKVYSEDLRPE